MQFAIRVIVLECSFVKHSHGSLGVAFKWNLILTTKESKSHMHFELSGVNCETNDK
jgi:hypothetical protein